MLQPIVGNAGCALEAVPKTTVGEVHPQEFWFNWSVLRSIMAMDLIIFHSFSPGKLCWSLRSALNSQHVPVLVLEVRYAQVSLRLPWGNYGALSRNLLGHCMPAQLHSCWRTTAYISAFSYLYSSRTSFIPRKASMFLPYRSVWICCLGPLREQVVNNLRFQGNLPTCQIRTKLLLVSSFPNGKMEVTNISHKPLGHMLLLLTRHY